MARTNKAKLAAIRSAIKKLFGANDAEVEAYVKAASEDRGEWAPKAVAVIYLEPDFRFPEDTGVIPNRLGYYSRDGFENFIKLDRATGLHSEYINAAVAAVYDG